MDCFKEYEQEQTKFFKACYDFLLKLSQLLGRGQFIVNTAMVFVLKVSRTCDFEVLNRYILSAAAFHLAAKTKDEPVTLSRLAESFIRLEKARNGGFSKISASINIPKGIREEYEKRIELEELEILSSIGFDCDIVLPNTYIAQIARKFEFGGTSLEKYSYSFLNDSFQTLVYLCHHPKIIAATCVYMSLTFHTKKQLPVKELPQDWFTQFDPELELDSILDAKNIIKTIY